jgi:hypothetical protein
MNDNWWVRMNIDRQKREDLIRRAEQEKLAEACKKQQGHKSGWIANLLKIFED